MLTSDKIAFTLKTTQRGRPELHLIAEVTLQAVCVIDQNEMMQASNENSDPILFAKKEDALALLWNLVYGELDGPLRELRQLLAWLEYHVKGPALEHPMATVHAARAKELADRMRDLLTPGPPPVAPPRLRPAERCNLCGVRGTAEALRETSCPRDKEGRHDFSKPLIPGLTGD